MGNITKNKKIIVGLLLSFFSIEFYAQGNYCEAPEYPNYFDNKNNQGTINNYGEYFDSSTEVNYYTQNNNVFVIIKSLGVYLSPSATEKLLFNKIKKKSGINFVKIDDVSLTLDKKIPVWKKQYKNFNDTIQNADTDIQDSVKRELEHYLRNIKTTKCLSEDYPQEILTTTSVNDKIEHLFNMEKIRNDPNYNFIGIESEGFVVVRHLNKYGYQSLNRNEENIPFKYNQCSPFKNGYAVTSDYNGTYIIDRSGDEVFKYPVKYKIRILPDSIFIISKPYKAGGGNNFNYSEFLIDSKGNKISDVYNSIIKSNSSEKVLIGKKTVKVKKESLNEFWEIESERNKKYVYRERDFYLKKDGTLFEKTFSCNKVIKNCISKTIKSKKCSISIEKIIDIPNTENEVLLICNNETNNLLAIRKKFEDEKVIDCIFFKNYQPKDLLQTYFDNDNFYFLLNNRNKTLNRIYTKIDQDYNVVFRNRTIFSASNWVYNSTEKNFISESIKNIKSINSKDKVIIFTDHTDSKDNYVGAMNFDGHYLILPIFKAIKYKDRIFDVTGFKIGTSYKLKLRKDLSVDCIENCKDYYRLTKQYSDIVFSK